MAQEYFVESNAVDSHQISPHWIMMVVPFAQRKSVDVDRFDGITFNVSKQDFAPLEEGEPIFLQHDCVEWNIASSKQSHVSSLTLSCKHSDVDYTQTIAPGDWVLVWAMNSEDEYNAVIKKIKDRTRANAWMDGFKFMGRIQTVFRNKVRQINSLNIDYQITASGFVELDNQIFYHPAYSHQYNQDAGGISFWMALDTDLQGLMATTQDARKPLMSQMLVPKLMNMLLGLPPVGQGTVGLVASSPNQPYLVPPTVASLVLLDDTNITYDKLLRSYIGVQQYSGEDPRATIGNDYGGGTKSEYEACPYKMFIPDLDSVRPNYLPQNWYKTRKDLTAQFLFIPGPFSGQSVWSIISTYVNLPVDEMYTCMRVDPHGYVMPTLMVRQTAFNSDQLGKKYANMVTTFNSLPRWVISDDLVSAIKTGTNETNRFNYIHLLGKDIVNTTQGDELAVGMARNPPMADLMDIRRSGLKLKMGSMNANLNEKFYSNGTSPGAFWQHVVADGLMNGHLKHAGQIACKGIVEPICEGDNCVVEGMLYHIEGVVHTGSVNPRGDKSWDTILNVSHGVMLDATEDHYTYYSDVDHPDEPTNRG